jgi:Alpha amylase, catalytic domain
VIYQVYVRSFADSDGDGVGDLAGVRDRLPYLADLGVDALWLTPFYPSPTADFGYDVADYRDVDPIFGSLADARSLIWAGAAPGSPSPENLSSPAGRSGARAATWSSPRTPRCGPCGTSPFP